MLEQQLTAELDGILANAIADKNLDAVNAVYQYVSFETARLIDKLIAKHWDVPVSSLSVIEEY
jgi:hypothetical protein